MHIHYSFIFISLIYSLFSTFASINGFRHPSGVGHHVPILVFREYRDRSVSDLGLGKWVGPWVNGSDNCFIISISTWSTHVCFAPLLGLESRYTIPASRNFRIGIFESSRCRSHPCFIQFYINSFSVLD